jgi:hypothetical protein
MTDIYRISVTYRSIMDSYHWEEFCEKYGINPWIINEGMAESSDHVDIDYRDAFKYGILKQEDSNE